MSASIVVADSLDALADRLAEALAEVEGVAPLTGTLDVAFHRDDVGLRRAGDLGVRDAFDPRKTFA